MQQHKGFSYPDTDKKLLQVHEWVDDIDVILKYVDRFDLCVQAGGAVGVWPVALAKHFKKVITFEPVQENFRCLIENIHRFGGDIYARKRALGRECGSVSMARDACEDGNAGAWYAAQGGDIETITIDSLDLDQCDLICLDVEGYEKNAILGAMGTIEKFKPVICLEEKQLPHMKEPCHLARAVLEDIGYKVVDRVHRDVILKC